MGGSASALLTDTAPTFAAGTLGQNDILKEFIFRKTYLTAVQVHVV